MSCIRRRNNVAEPRMLRFFSCRVEARRLMAFDDKGDIDRLFACFKCGISPPASALRDRSGTDGKPARFAKGGHRPLDKNEEGSRCKRVDENSMERQKASFIRHHLKLKIAK
ncbi:hypothetical protein HPP92_015080 [Vanilla planifolia]|uniref:Uncharacterized protein n=1 Tax=Vanilla planifolia TaxID=51239 RepID=A0A835QRD4_VANPL|nr:hypothetical protein HPP92_015080 [Vanilla planifolia]